MINFWQKNEKMNMGGRGGGSPSLLVRRIEDRALLETFVILR